MRGGVENRCAIWPPWSARMGSGAERLDIVRPRTCLVYAAFGERFAPVFVRGVDGPAILSTDAPVRPARAHRAARRSVLAAHAHAAARRARRTRGAGRRGARAGAAWAGARRCHLSRRQAIGRRLHPNRSDAARRGRGQGVRRAAALRRRRHSASGARDERRSAQLCSGAGGVASDAWAIDRGRRARRLRAVRGHPGLHDVLGAAGGGDGVLDGQPLHRGCIGGDPASRRNRRRVSRRRAHGGIRGARLVAGSRARVRPGRVRGGCDGAPPRPWCCRRRGAHRRWGRLRAAGHSSATFGPATGSSTPRSAMS